MHELFSTILLKRANNAATADMKIMILELDLTRLNNIYHRHHHNRCNNLRKLQSDSARTFVLNITLPRTSWNFLLKFSRNFDNNLLKFEDVFYLHMNLFCTSK